ncbi:MAG: hypothetical protein JNL70_21390 [Saprospiraceae bacterium]|nr:hypothetical protein [Saprospiraceae bacterium]
MELKQKCCHFTNLEKTPTVALVLPVFNPPTDWWMHSYQFCKHLAHTQPFYQWEFHFVNDGSTASPVFPLPTGHYTEGGNLDIYFHSYAQNRGKGYAIRYGFQQVSDDIDIFMHCDWDFPFGTDLILSALKEIPKVDVVVADRGSEYLKHLPPLRQKITQMQRLINRYIFRLKTTDTQAGFKAFNQHGKAVFLNTRINGFLFDTEFVRLSERNQLSISSLSASCRNNLQFKNFRFKVLVKEIVYFLILFFQ